MPPNKNIILPCGELFLLEEGIVQMNLMDLIYSENEVKQIVEAVGQLTEGKRVYQLFNSTLYSSVTSSARKFMAKPEATRYSIAEAYVIHSLSQRIVGNFYLKLDKPKVPTRLFTKYDEALNWLRKHKKEN